MGEQTLTVPSLTACRDVKKWISSIQNNNTKYAAAAANNSDSEVSDNLNSILCCLVLYTPAVEDQKAHILKTLTGAMMTRLGLRFMEGGICQTIEDDDENVDPKNKKNIINMAQIDISTGNNNLKDSLSNSDNLSSEFYSVLKHLSILGLDGVEPKTLNGDSQATVDVPLTVLFRIKSDKEFSKSDSESSEIGLSTFQDSLKQIRVFKGTDIASIYSVIKQSLGYENAKENDDDEEDDDENDDQENKRSNTENGASNAGIISNLTAKMGALFSGNTKESTKNSQDTDGNAKKMKSNNLSDSKITTTVTKLSDSSKLDLELAASLFFPKQMLSFYHQQQESQLRLEAVSSKAFESSDGLTLTTIAQNAPGTDAILSELRIRRQLYAITHKRPIMLFMKGEKQRPFCKFSKQAIRIMNQEVFNTTGNSDSNYGAVNVFEELEIREKLKKYSDWQTYPQLYVDGELQGGIDIMLETHEEKELEPQLKEARWRFAKKLSSQSTEVKKQIDNWAFKVRGAKTEEDKESLHLVFSDFLYELVHSRRIILFINVSLEEESVILNFQKEVLMAASEKDILDLFGSSSITDEISPSAMCYLQLCMSISIMRFAIVNLHPDALSYNGGEGSKLSPQKQNLVKLSPNDNMWTDPYFDNENYKPIMHTDLELLSKTQTVVDAINVLSKSDSSSDSVSNSISNTNFPQLWVKGKYVMHADEVSEKLEDGDLKDELLKGWDKFDS